MHRKKEDKKSETLNIDVTHISERDLTFRNNSVRWPISLPSSDSMAEAGFYFTPTDKYPDCCTCYRCGIKVFNWLPDDTPKFEHKKLSPSCKEVKSWTDILKDDPERLSINRAEQTDHRFRTKLADKAKRLTGAFHRKHDVPKPSEPLKSMSKEAEKENAIPSDSNRNLNEEEKLANIRRQREVAEKALEGLEKIATAYPQGSVEQKRADQSIVLQMADLERLRSEEAKLVSSMDSLSFGRSWNTHTPKVESPSNEDESPLTSRSRRPRPLPMLPSQMLKNSVPLNPAHIKRSDTSEADRVPTYGGSSTDQDGIPTYEQYQQMTRTDSYAAPAASESEWIEYFTEEGVPYYYSTKTQKTVWQIPSSSSIPMSPVS